MLYTQPMWVCQVVLQHVMMAAVYATLVDALLCLSASGPPSRKGNHSLVFGIWPPPSPCALADRGWSLLGVSPDSEIVTVPGAVATGLFGFHHVAAAPCTVPDALYRSFQISLLRRGISSDTMIPATLNFGIRDEGNFALGRCLNRFV